MRRDAFVLVGCVLLIAMVAVVPAGAQRVPAVDGAVLATPTLADARAHAGPVLAVDPQDPGVVPLAHGEAYASACGLQVSTNGGLSWTAATVPVPDDAPLCVWSNNGPIVDVAFAPDGDLFYAFSAGGQAEWPRRTIYVARSPDLGRSFSSVTRVPTPEADLDTGEVGVHAMPKLGFDPARQDRVYVVWRSNYGVWNLGHLLPGDVDFHQRPLLSVSDDDGRTFSAPVDAAGDHDGSVQTPELAVDGSGNLLVFYGESAGFGGDEPLPGANLYVAVSRDGGQTFAQDTIHRMPDGETTTILNGPVAAVDPAGGVWVVWEDMGGGPARVLLTHTANGGRTWAEPVKVNDVDPEREWTFNELWPSLAIAPDGRLDVAWYDSRDDVVDDDAEEARYQHVYYTHSSDGGATWAPSVRVSDRVIDRTLGIWHTGMRAPVGLASTEQAALLTWDDTRSGNPTTMTQDIYAGRVRFAAPAVAFGSQSPMLLTGLRSAGIGLAAAGLVLLLGSRLVRRRLPDPVV